MSYIDTTMWLLAEHRTVPFASIDSLTFFMWATGNLTQHEEQE